MSRSRRERSRRRLFGFLGLLLLLALLLPLSAFLAGLLPGGGHLDRPDGGESDAREAGTLRVTVLSSEDESPVEGARIVIAGASGKTAAAQSDANGEAVVAGLGNGPVRVEASHDGRTVAKWTDPGLADEIQLAVAPERVRRGQVRDAAGGAVASPVLLVGPGGEVLAEAETDSEGYYELPDHPRAVAVCATPTDGAPASATNGDVVVGEGVQVEGKLVGARNGVLEVYGLAPEAGGDGLLPLRARWPVRRDGSYAGYLPEGARAWGIFDGRPVRVAGGDTDLPARQPARGRVSGAERGGVTLVFRPVLDGDFPAPLPPVQVRANADGSFLAELAAVRYAVEISAPGCATRIFPDVEPRDDLAWTLAPGYAVEGTVVDTAGLPVGDVEVKALGLPEAGDQPIASTRTDPEGRFRLEGLGGESARVHVHTDGFHPTTLDRVKPAAAVRVVLQPR